MGTVFYDNTGNIVLPTEPIGAPDQQVADRTGNIINPAREDGNLLSIETNTDNLDVLLSTRATEATVLAIKTQTDQLTFSATRLVVDGSGVIQPVSQSGTWNLNNITGTVSLPTGAATEATLGTLLLNSTFTGRINTLGQKTMANSTPIVISSDQTAIPASQSGTWNVRLQDGAGTALTSSLVNARQALDIHQADTSFIVSGLTAVGNAPSLNPVSVSGIDEGGLKRHLLTDITGKQIITSRTVVSTANSTTATLGAGASFNGTYEDVKDYSVISIMIFSDQASSAGGFLIDWSSDGVNIDDTDTLSYSPSNTANKQYTFGPIARYFKIRYTNGATPQTAFRLQSMFRPFGIKPSSHRIGNTISAEADAELVKAVITAENESSGFANVSATSIFGTHRLKTSAVDIRLELTNLDKIYTISADQNLPTNGAENVAFLIRNPIANTKKMFISNAIFDVVTKDRQCTWRVYKNPTVTGTGSATTISSTRIGGSPPATVMEAFTGPTVSANGTRIRNFSTGVNANSTDIDFALGFIVEPGNALLITGIPNGNNVVVGLSMQWAEI